MLDPLESIAPHLHFWLNCLTLWFQCLQEEVATVNMTLHIYEFTYNFYKSKKML